MNKVILYIATSQDGFIADAHGGVDWLSHPKTPEDLELHVGNYQTRIEAKKADIGNWMNVAWFV